MLRSVLVLVAVCAVATVLGLIALWPSEEDLETAVSNADEMGLVTDRLSAVVTDVTDQRCSYSTPERPQLCRVISFELTEGPDEGDVLSLPEFNLLQDRVTDRVEVGDKIIVGYEDATDFYFYADRDRRVSLAWLGVLFAAIVVGFGRLRGLLALIAMASTLVVLIVFVGPSVLDGNDPVLVSVVAAAAIAFVSLYLTHGFTPTTTIALSGTLAALGLTFGLSWAMFEIARFTGLATEEALILPFLSENINVAGLLLGGAVIGALGALDDVTVTQVATVAELRRRNPNLSSAELITSGIRIGREHIASTVNTLLLAYAGASMPLLLAVCCVGPIAGHDRKLRTDRRRDRAHPLRVHRPHRSGPCHHRARRCRPASDRRRILASREEAATPESHHLSNQRGALVATTCR